MEVTNPNFLADVITTGSPTLILSEIAEGGTTERAEGGVPTFLLPITLAPQSVSQSVKRPSHIVWRGRPMHGAFEASTGLG